MKIMQMRSHNTVSDAQNPIHSRVCSHLRSDGVLDDENELSAFHLPRMSA